MEEQAKGPIVNPVEMAMPDEARRRDAQVDARSTSPPSRRPSPRTRSRSRYDNVGRAIGAFERQLVTPSRWDKYLGGDRRALTEPEKAGFATFVEARVRSVPHRGPTLGGAMYQKLGLVKPWPNLKDDGRFDVTKHDSDKMMFKVPTPAQHREDRPVLPRRLGRSRSTRPSS